jgi:NitT/TauT family transport system substrate-binding protein
MEKMHGFIFFLLSFFLTFSTFAEKKVIRIGHFPNVTHAQGLIGHALSREEKGWFEKYLDPEVEIQWFVYNAGPSAMEAIFANSIDMVYVGPSPAINAYLRSNGEEIRIVAGSCSGGAAFVVQPGKYIANNVDFKGKKIGTPQLGSTQDIAARYWLSSKGYKFTIAGGDVFVVPVENPDQLFLFQQKELDAVWTVEPWVSILLLNGKA